MAVGDLYSVTPAGSVPDQPGPVMAYFCALPPSGALSRDLKYIGPAVEHGHQVVPVTHVGDAEDPRLP